VLVELWLTAADMAETADVGATERVATATAAGAFVVASTADMKAAVRILPAVPVGVEAAGSAALSVAEEGRMVVGLVS